MLISVNIQVPSYEGLTNLRESENSSVQQTSERLNKSSFAPNFALFQTSHLSYATVEAVFNSFQQKAQ